MHCQYYRSTENQKNDRNILDVTPWDCEKNKTENSNDSFTVRRRRVWKTPEEAKDFLKGPNCV